MHSNVLKDFRHDQAFAGIPIMKTLAEFSRRNAVVDGLNQMNTRALLWCQAEGGDAVEREAGAADDDPLGKLEQACWLVPMWEREEAVCSDKIEERGLGIERPQQGECVDGVVGFAVRVGCI